jgi:biotin carboxyl carrier protein
MPGTVVRILVEEGDSVAAGETVVVLEAMKMETEVKSEQGGTVTHIAVDQGQAVASGDVLIALEEN